MNCIVFVPSILFFRNPFDNLPSSLLSACVHISLVFLLLKSFSKLIFFHCCRKYDLHVGSVLKVRLWVWGKDVF